MAQSAFISRRIWQSKDGRRTDSGWNGVENLQGTFFDFMLNLRLKYSEDIFRDRLDKLGVAVKAPVKLTGLALNEHAQDEYKVTVTCESPDGDSFKVKSKYIIGADGGSSAVRELAKIPFIGAEKEDHWVRIDGIVKSNIPEARLGNGLIASKTHVQVLWVALDHGATRIGFPLTPAMYAKYGRHMKQEEAIEEAKAGVAPYEIEFTQVDWHTVYVVKQRVADRLQDRERILLAGDAAHVHSSGSAQGMNTGTHDAVCLAWRLAGVLNGLYKPEVLATYSTERKAVAEHLIENDKIIATYVSGRKPAKFEHRPEDIPTLVDEFLREESGFSVGLGIKYPSNLLNDVQGSYPPLAPVPGHRAPDVMLQKHAFTGVAANVRLYEVMKNNGKFHILVFAGDARDTREKLKTLRRRVDDTAIRFQHAVEFRTIIMGTALVFEEYLGVRQFGDAYWDVDQTAHHLYKVTADQGAIAVVRPDAILGFVAPLDGFDSIVEYLSRVVVSRTPVKGATNSVNGHVGEMINQDESSLKYQKAKVQDGQLGIEQGIVMPDR